MRKYADDYEIVYEEGKKGKEKQVAVYKGQYYQVNVEEAHLVNFRRISVLVLIIVLLLHIGSGFVNHRETLFRFLELPYAIAFLPLYFLVVGVLRLPREKRKLRRDEVDLSFVDEEIELFFSNHSAGRSFGQHCIFSVAC